MLNKYYNNAKELKIDVLKDNKGKSGIYKWTNKINNKTYVGSAINLAERLRKYFSANFLKKILLKSRSLISKSLLKHNYKNFSLEILEYCEPKLLIKREQYYIDLLKPEYNICKIAGSPLGRKHTKESIAKMKQNSGFLTTVLNIKDNSKKEYLSRQDVAKDLNLSVRTIFRYLDTTKLLKRTYLIYSTKI